MDVNTGHLITADERNRLISASRENEVRLKDILDSYAPVPDALQKAVELKLAGKEEAMVSLTSGGKLSRWAAQERAKHEKDNRRNKSRMQKKSRKRNRR